MGQPPVIFGRGGAFSPPSPQGASNTITPGVRGLGVEEVVVLELGLELESPPARVTQVASDCRPMSLRLRSKMMPLQAKMAAWPHMRRVLEQNMPMPRANKLFIAARDTWLMTQLFESPGRCFGSYDPGERLSGTQAACLRLLAHKKRKKSEVQSAPGIALLRCSDSHGPGQRWGVSRFANR